MSKANGGFPPINVCLEDLQKIMNNNEIKPLKTQKTETTKQRLYVPNNNNINIRQILKDSIVKPIIKTNEIKEEELIIVDSF
jgi:hypothetical protein